MGAFLAILTIILGAAFCVWCVLRVAGYQSRIEEQYRFRKALEKAAKKKKGKK